MASGFSAAAMISCFLDRGPCTRESFRLEEQNPLEEPVHEQDRVSTADPDSTHACRSPKPRPTGIDQRVTLLSDLINA
jgi:hypothetical protein